VDPKSRFFSPDSVRLLEIFRESNKKMEIIEILVFHDCIDLFLECEKEMDDFDIRFQNDRFLCIAAYNHSHQIACYLLEHGLDVACQNNYPIRAAANRCYEKDIQMLQLFIDYGADIHANHDISLCYVLYCENINAIKFLIDLGADVNAWENKPLLYAIDSGSEELVNLLIDVGADYNERKFLMCAIENRDQTILKLLISWGADVCKLVQKDIVKIIKLGYKPIIQILADAGLDFGLVNDYKLTGSNQDLASTLLNLNLEPVAIINILYDVIKSQ
jgi:hypothetical protein